MCGLAGIISADTSFVSAERLKQMTHALAHRGPDGEGQWVNPSGHVGLGHRRLSVIDLSEAGYQPMNYAGRYHIIHNGEVYNYIELREELEKKGYSFQSQTDTEVMAAAYAAYGEDCLDHFDGMFAFAIWDEQQQKLFAARDRFGEKPLFYFFDKTKFLFASEMKALWAAGIQRTPNLKMLFNFLTIGYSGNPNRPEETFFENIYKLPPACFLIYSMQNHELMIEKYWDIDVAEEGKISDEEATEQFSSLLRRSVKRRWRSDVPAGTSLSGGLDSSSIVAMSHSLQKSGSSYKCFTSSFPCFEKDETALAAGVAETYGLCHFSVPVYADDLIEEWEKLCHHQEEPFGSSGILAQYKLYRLAAKYDVVVLLDGQGADETLAGYHKYYKWYWQELFRKRKLLRSGELKAAKQLGIPEKFGIRNVLAALFPEFAAVMLERQYLLHALQHPDLTREFVKHQSKEAYYSAPAISSLNSQLYFHTCVHGLEELLRYADRNSMAHGREVRLPFLNHELVEFVFSLPPHFKIRNGWTKWILRNAMKNILPPEIAWRRDKVGFEPPQKQWMQQKPIQQFMMAGKEILVKEKILKPETLHKKIKPRAAYEAGNFDWRCLSASFLFK
jgi:asparagine synthase (glutamine-hydrolysing)